MDNKPSRRKRRKSGYLNKSDEFSADDVNPMEGVANLADAMLVLVVGLLMAIITYWNVDVTGIATDAAEVSQGQEVTEMNGLDGSSSNSENDGQYEEYGKVYRDASTGKLYMVTGDGNAQSADENAGNAGETAE